ncbi:ribonuclease III domain-containing protein [Syncephalis fuscata]|nr:ribonuclease III domain-containing protein [Syncephalis fuscata]
MQRCTKLTMFSRLVVRTRLNNLAIPSVNYGRSNIMALADSDINSKIANNKLENPTNEISPALFSFAARLGLGDIDPQVLLQAVTHKSFAHGRVATNERLEFLGKIESNGLFVTEHLHLKYPVLPSETISDALQAYAGRTTLAIIGKEIGVARVMRWKVASNDPENHQGEDSVMARIVRSLIGGIYHQKEGSKAARDFIHQHILSRKVDVESLLPLTQPKRILSALMKRKGMEKPVSRLIRESGRASNAPVFVVGVYSGNRRLAEAYGSSIKMAEHRAAKDALLKYYLTEVKDFTYPSDFEGMESEAEITFFPQKLGDTQVIL